jgi:hypothetical protein
VAWLRDAQFRWGVNTTHRYEHQPFEEHRWNLFWALQRLGLGDALAPENEPAPLKLPHQDASTVALERTSGLGLATLAQLAKFAHGAGSRTQRLDLTPNLSQSAPGASTFSASQLTFSLAKKSRHPSISPLSKIWLSPHSSAPHLQHKRSSLQTRSSVSSAEKLDAISESGARGISGINVADLKQYAGLPARLTLVRGPR